METSKFLFGVRFERQISHSLGKLIEWKHIPLAIGGVAKILSHSLGKLIEWKPTIQSASAEILG